MCILASVSEHLWGGHSHRVDNYRFREIYIVLDNLLFVNERFEIVAETTSFTRTSNLDFRRGKEKLIYDLYNVIT